jgi:hypothetical protein
VNSGDSMDNELGELWGLKVALNCKTIGDEIDLESGPKACLRLRPKLTVFALSICGRLKFHYQPVNRRSNFVAAGCISFGFFCVEPRCVGRHVDIEFRRCYFCFKAIVSEQRRGGWDFCFVGLVFAASSRF